MILKRMVFGLCRGPKSILSKARKHVNPENYDNDGDHQLEVSEMASLTMC